VSPDAGSRPHTDGMWTHLAPWLVKTGEVPQLEVGDTLREVGLRAAYWSLSGATAPPGAVERTGDDPAGHASPHYDLTGTVEWVGGSDAVVLRADDLRVVATPRPGVETRLPEVGSTVTVVATIEAMGLYDAAAADAPDVRRDWLVGAIKVEHRALVPTPGFPGQTEPGRIVRVDDIGRMLRWADASSKDHASYLLDLAPIPRV
jgi:hypothetical protein